MGSYFDIKPTKGKIIVSLVLTAASYLIFSFAAACPFFIFCEFEASLSALVMALMFFVVSPFILVYALLSFGQNRAVSKTTEFKPLGTIPTQLQCMRCGGKLNLLIVGSGKEGAAPQIYFCEKCGYRGPVGLEPGLVKISKKKKI